MTKFRSLAVISAALLALAGCAGNQSASSYSQSQARGEMNVRMGVVESVRQVNIEGEKTPVGTLAGAAIGGMAGSNVGGGRGSNVGAILGAVAGGMAGHAIEQNVSKRAGLEITVKLESGQYIAVTQEADDTFRPGERVRVLSGQGVTRVSH